MLDKNQWLALGLLSGFAYILGKDRESFEAELLNAKELEKYLDEEFFPNDAVNINEYDNGKIISEGYIGMDKDEDGIEGLTMIKSQRPGYDAESFEAETPCAVMVLKDGVLTECGWWNENNEPCVYHPDGKEIKAESFEAHEYSYYHRNKALKAWRKNYEASGILDDRAKWNELYDSFDKYKSQGFSQGQSMVKSMKEMGIYNQLMQGVNVDAFLDHYSAESFDAESFEAETPFGAEPELVGGPCEICGEDLFRDSDDSMGDVCLSCYYEERSKQDNEGNEYNGWLVNFAESFEAESFGAIEMFNQDKDEFIGERDWEGFSPANFEDAQDGLFRYIHDSKRDVRTKMAMIAIYSQGMDNLGKMMDAESFEAEYTLNQMAEKSFKEIDKISGFVADRLNHTQESWSKLPITKRQKILRKIRKDEDGWFDLYSLDAESFEAEEFYRCKNCDYNVELEVEAVFEGGLCSNCLVKEGFQKEYGTHGKWMKKGEYAKKIKGATYEDYDAESFEAEYNLIGRRKPRKLSLKVSDLKEALENANDDADVFVGDITPVWEEMIGEPIVSAPRGVWTNGEEVYIVGATDWILTEQIDELTWNRVNRAKGAESFEAENLYNSQKENMTLVALGRAHKEILDGPSRATMEIRVEDKPVIFAIYEAANYFAPLTNPIELQSRYDSHNFVEPDWRDEYHQALSALKEAFPSWSMFSPKLEKSFDL